MIIHKGISTLQTIKDAVVTIGSFDGVHDGHKAILASLCQTAQEYKAESVVITFYPHPRKVLGLDTAGFKLLNTLEEKEFLLSQYGVDHLVEVEFTRDFSRQNSETFIASFLCAHLRLKAMVVGYDHHFGCDRKGDFQSLGLLGRQYGFAVKQVPQHLVGDEKVSSTIVRKLIAQGKVDTAAKALGYPYFMIASVSEQGVVMGTDNMKMIPGEGSYRVALCKNYQMAKESVFLEKNAFVDACGTICINDFKPSVLQGVGALMMICFIDRHDTLIVSGQ